MRKKLSFKGIILGALVDVGGSAIWGVLLGIYMVFQYHLYSHPQVSQSAQLQNLMLHDPMIITLNSIIGGGFSVLGGYVAARIAKQNKLLNATLSSFLCEISGLLSFGSAPLWMILASLIANPLLNLGGGYLHILQLRKKNKSKKSSK